MSNLTQTVANTRKVIIAFVLFASAVMIFQYIKSAVDEGKINIPLGNPSTTYLSPTKNKADFTRYPLTSLETLNVSKPEFFKVRDFGTFPDTVNVYKIKEKEILLSPLENARAQAETLKLDPNYETVESGILYRWRGGLNNITMEFNTQTRSLSIKSRLSDAARTPIEKDTEDVALLSSAKTILTGLKISPEELTATKGRVDYISVDSQGNIQTAEKSNATLVRVTLFKEMESATLRSQQAVAPTGAAALQNIVSEVRQPDIITGAVTMILNGEATTIDNLVELEYTPFEYSLKLSTSPTIGANNTSKSAKYDFDVYRTIEMGNAYNMVQAGAEGSYLVYLSKSGENLFDNYIPLSVKKFSIDAPKTRLIYIEPENFDHVEQGKTKTLYPYYWFEGIAQLENNENADFVFLVDAIER